jgi:hypothetical protein
MKAATRSGWVQKKVMKRGAAVALWRMAIPSRLAAGAGESRATMSSSDWAKEKTSSNGTGPRSFMVRLTMAVGSSVYCLRTVVRRGRKRGIKGGMLLSVS